MKKVEFIESLENVEADLLILCNKALEEKMDQELKGALSFNLRREKRPFLMTTNGFYRIPKIILANEDDDLSLLITEKRVVLAFEKDISFKMLLQKTEAETLFFLNQKKEAFEKALPLLEAISKAKELISSPANLMTPAIFAKECESLRDFGVDVTIFDEVKLKEMGMEAILAVGKGSSHPPRVVILQWKGASSDPYVIVGKGICFDAGGINLKTTNLTEMKWDKAGAGVAFGVIEALAKMKSSLNVVSILTLAENMPDGNSLKPGDVISSFGGKRIEIVDTDCEGRLVLADGLSYGQKMFSPQAIIDLGTLTLETFGALGGEYAGLFANDEALKNRLIEAGLATNEKLWPLPLGPYYAKQIHSKIADLKNAGGFRYGASSAAAEFLRAFVKPETVWAHIDIAGTAWNLAAPEEGVSAFGLQLLINFLTGFKL